MVALALKNWSTMEQDGRQDLSSHFLCATMYVFSTAPPQLIQCYTSWQEGHLAWAEVMDNAPNMLTQQPE
jgi:hypothetical protein